jgi:hypothetical protein
MKSSRKRQEVLDSQKRQQINHACKDVPFPALNGRGHRVVFIIHYDKGLGAVSRAPKEVTIAWASKKASVTNRSGENVVN